MAELRTVTIRVPSGVTVGDLVRICRVAARLKANEMARLLGLSLKTYQRTEDGTREPRRSELIAIAQITGQEFAVFGPLLADGAGEVLPDQAPNLKAAAV